MDFFLSEEQLAIREAVREFAQKEIAPHADELDRSGQFPWDHVKKLADHGYLGMTIPEAYGGGGMDTLMHAMCLEEVARACATTAVIMDVHNSLVSDLITRWADEPFKQRYLPKLAAVELLGAFCLTEPQAGSHASNLSTTAVRKGDRYVLNGRKVFITNGGMAHVYVVFAVTDPEAGERGISAFLVHGDWPGVSFGKLEDKLGLRASATCDVILEDVECPAENLIGREGEGYKIALATLDDGRVGIGAQAVGIAQAGLDRALRYAQEREQFGQPIAQFQAIQWMLADMATEVEAARLMVYRAAQLYDRSKETGERYSGEISMAKLFASEVAMRQTVKAVQIHGGYGYIRDYQVERLMRDAKITELYEGTSEVQRMVIAGSLLRRGTRGSGGPAPLHA